MTEQWIDALEKAERSQWDEYCDNIYRERAARLDAGMMTIDGGPLVPPRGNGTIRGVLAVLAIFGLALLALLVSGVD